MLIYVCQTREREDGKGESLTKLSNSTTDITIGRKIEMKKNWSSVRREGKIKGRRVMRENSEMEMRRKTHTQSSSHTDNRDGNSLNLNDNETKERGNEGSVSVPLYEQGER